MSDVLVVSILTGPGLARSDAATVGFGRQVAEKLGCEVDLLVVGSEPAAAADEGAKLPVRRVLVAKHADLADGTGEARTAAIAAAAQQGDYRLLCAASSTNTRDCLPRLAARLGGPMASDVVEVRGADADAIALTKPCFSGNLLQEIELCGARNVATVRASAFDAPPETAQSASIEEVQLSGELNHPRKRFVELQKTELTRPELTEADVVVSGGRGTRGAEGFKLLEELADLLGAAVGASRAVVDSGWMPNDFQVGQTGKVIAPKLYLCAGLSGAIQHLAGMRNSKTIVAINKDANAPIFEVADYGLVADLFEAVPQLTAAIRAAREAS